MDRVGDAIRDFAIAVACAAMAMVVVVVILGVSLVEVTPDLVSKLTRRWKRDDKKIY